ncbi:MAG: hypothetical protein V4591_03055 [Bdellovibrionota bacterium]
MLSYCPKIPSSCCPSFWGKGSDASTSSSDASKLSATGEGLGVPLRDLFGAESGTSAAYSDDSPSKRKVSPAVKYSIRAGSLASGFTYVFPSYKGAEAALDALGLGKSQVFAGFSAGVSGLAYASALEASFKALSEHISENGSLIPDSTLAKTLGVFSVFASLSHFIAGQKGAAALELPQEVGVAIGAILLSVKTINTYAGALSFDIILNKIINMMKTKNYGNILRGLGSFSLTTAYCFCGTDSSIAAQRSILELFGVKDVDQMSRYYFYPVAIGGAAANFPRTLATIWSGMANLFAAPDAETDIYTYIALFITIWTSSGVLGTLGSHKKGELFGQLEDVFDHDTVVWFTICISVLYIIFGSSQNVTDHLRGGVRSFSRNPVPKKPAKDVMDRLMQPLA